MAIRNAFSRLICGGFLLLFLLSACRKEENQETVVHIRCVMPHNDQPIQGCRVTITEGKMKSQGLNVDFETIQQFSGITDANGVATIKFHYKKKNKFQYALSYDYSAIVPPNGLTNLDIKLPSTSSGWSTYLDKKQFEYYFTFNVLGLCGVHAKFVNVNCFDETDEMKYDFYNLSLHQSESISGPGAATYAGCGVLLDATTPTINQVKTGKVVYKLFITRNNQTHIEYDTFNLQPNMMNEVFIEY